MACPFCLQGRCITSSAFKPQGRSNARITNHTKRGKDYKWYWCTLRACGLWENPVYLAHKQQLGCLIDDDVREVTPNCVVKDVRDRWPNPSGVPYTKDTANLKFHVQAKERAVGNVVQFGDHV